MTLIPTPFEGLNSENPDDFLADCESFFKFRKLSEDEKIGAFALLLKGPAKYWLNSLQNNDKKFFKELKEEFQIRFANNTATQFANMKELMQMQQMPHESVEHYINRGQRLAKRANANDEQWLFPLVNGFNEKIRANVIINQAASLDEIRKQALLTEGAMPAQINEANSLLLQSIISRLDRMDARGFQTGTPNYQFQTQFQSSLPSQFQTTSQTQFQTQQGFKGGRTLPPSSSTGESNTPDFQTFREGGPSWTSLPRRQ